MKLRILTQQENKSDPLFAAPQAQQLLEVYDSYYPKIGYELPWVAYLVLHNHQLVGTCSFTRRPKGGAVEIAYWTFEPFEGQGIASFACKSLIDIAQKHDPAIAITAKTAPEHNASTKILQKNGFVFSTVVQDDDIGDAWLWIWQRE